jgi:protein-S-isoprenylcysteine O-methyltransferase Ste14
VNRLDLKLFIQAIVKFLSGIILLSVLLFIPAGTLYYWNAWLFFGALFIPMFIAGTVLMFKNPELLRKRLNAKEEEAEQKSAILLSSLMFVGGFVVAGLDFRFKWLVLPKGVVIAATVVFLLAYLLFGEVLRENTYLSRTIEVQENQKVISTGLYGIVRHPMYTATIFLFLSMPLVLGSLFSFIVFLLYPFIIAKRIKNEEEVLEKNLEGYSEYKKRVKYRMIPFIW